MAPQPLLNQRKNPRRKFLAVCSPKGMPFMKQELEVAKSEQAMKTPVCKSVYPDKRKKCKVVLDTEAEFNPV